MKVIASTSLAVLLLVGLLRQPACAVPEEQNSTNSTRSSKKLFTYAGPLLPSDWQLVSVVNDRAVIAFSNGTAKNAPLAELEPKERSFVERLQNGTVYSTPLASAKEKIAQWSSSVSSTVSKLSKSVREQLDSLINNKPISSPTPNSTLIQDTTIINN